MKSKFVYQRFNRSALVGHIYIFARHKFRKQGLLLAQNLLDALTFGLDRHVQIGNGMVDAIILSPIHAASQEPVVVSA